MFAIVGILAGLTAVTQAQDLLYLKFNASQSAPKNGYEMWRDAQSHPNVTHDVEFDRWNQTEDGKDWGWSIGITDVYRPNLTVLDPNDLEESHNISNVSVALTTYSFSWPGGGSLNAAAADGYPGGQTSENADFGPSCLYMVLADFPQNVSDAWDSSSASCASAIGDPCVQTIMDGFSGVDCDSGNFPSFDVSNDTSCSGSFGATSSGLTVNAYPFGNASAAANGSAFESGDVFGWILSDAYTPGNKTAFAAESNKLRMVVLTDVTQNIIGKQVLCNRAGPGGSSDKTSGSIRSAGVEAWSVVVFALIVVLASICSKSIRTRMHGQIGIQKTLPFHVAILAADSP